MIGEHRENGKVAMKQLICEYCHSSFKRREHLDRHLHRHSRSRPFTCDVCSKSFSRRDTLKRHVVTHGADATLAFTVSSARESKRNARACIKCSNSKQKCDGNLPCHRCEERGKACGYTELVATQSHHSSSVEQAFSSQQDLAFVPGQNLETLPQRSGSSSTSVGGQALSPEARGGSCAAIHPPMGSENDIVNPPQFEAFETFDFDPSHSINAFGLIPPFWIPDFCDLPVALTDQSNLGALDSSQSIHRTIPFSQQFDSSADLDNNCLAVDIPARSAELAISPNTTSAGQTYREPNNAERNAQDGDYLTPRRQNDYAIVEIDEISSEYFYHVPGVSEVTYGYMISFWRRYCRDNFDVDNFPDLRQLNVLVQLYFEYFHVQTPIIHVPTFRPDKQPCLLLTALATIGCHYSAMRNVRKLESSLHVVLRVALLEQVKNVMNCDISTTQSLFLYSICMLIGGSKECFMQFQCQRSFLVTMCRPFIAAHGSIFKNTKIESYRSSDQNDWKAWIKDEAIRRIIYAVWFLDCFNLVLHDVPVALSMSDLSVNLPSPDRLWESPSFQSWVDERNKEETMSCCTLQEFFTRHKSKPNLANFDGFTRSIVLITMYVEERSYLAITTSWVYSQINHNLVLPNAAAHQDATLPRQVKPVRQLDAEFEAFKLVTSSSIEEKASERLCRRTHHLLSILRRVSIRKLYTAARLHASEHAWKLALHELSKWIKEDSENARSTLVHAARLFRDIRNQGIVSPHDPFCLLVATLVIWNYTGYIYRFGDIPSETSRPIRLDLSQNNLEIREWINHGHNKALHITGIGLLSDCTSGSRTLKEAVRIFKSQRTWSGLSDSIAQTVPKMLDGLELVI